MASDYWLSVAGVPRDELLSRLNLVETGETATMASWHSGQRDVGVIMQRSGRVLLLSRREPFEDEEGIRATTGGGEAILGWWASVVSAAGVSAFANGRGQWSIESGFEDDEEMLVTDGELPVVVNAILSKAEADEDLWGGVTAVSVKLCGYEPEGDGADSELEVRFAVDAAVAEKRAAKAAGKESGGFFGRLFRR